MRLFIAATFPPEVLRDLNERVARLRPRLPAASWVREGTQHLTFAFLGEQPESLIEGIAPALIAGLSTIPRFDAHLEGSGFFPNARRARVGWIGIEPDEKFAAIAHVVRDIVTKNGVTLDGGEFRPHLTLMRIRDGWPPASIDLFAKTLHDYRSGPFPVDAITLFSSQLNPKGAIHTSLATFALADARPEARPLTEYLDRPVGWLHPRYAEAAYDELSFWGSRFGALLFDNLEIRRDVRGLDVACGAGFPLLELAHVHGASSHFIGIDLWRDALTRARGKLDVYGLRNVELVEGNAQSMPFDDASFDLITSNLGINNFDDPAQAMAECFRVARPGARIALTTNLTGHMKELYEIFRATLRELNRDDLLPALDAQEVHRGTRATIESLIANAGFQITRVVESHFELPFADGSAMLRHPLVNFFLWGWRGVTEDRAIYARLEEKLNAASPLRMAIPMLYAEGVRFPSS